MNQAQPQRGCGAMLIHRKPSKNITARGIFRMNWGALGAYHIEWDERYFGLTHQATTLAGLGFVIKPLLPR